MSLKLSLALIIVLSFISLFTPSHGAEDKPDDYLIPHNEERAKFGLPPFKWSKKLADYAYSIAVTHKKGCELVHSTGDYGENISGGSGPDMTGTDATNLWLSEKEFYDRNTKTCAEGKQCGHYENIIASETTEMGCAKIHCDKDDGLIFQCDYYM